MPLRTLLTKERSLPRLQRPQALQPRAQALDVILLRGDGERARRRHEKVEREGLEERLQNGRGRHGLVQYGDQV